MKTFSIKEALKRGWEIWKDNKKVLTLTGIVMILIGWIPNPADGLLGAVFEVILFLISAFVSMSWLKMLLVMEGGGETRFSDLFKHRRFFWKYFFASLLLILITGIGLILFIIPGIYFAMKYIFVLNLIVDKDMAIGAAFRESAKLTRGIKWRLLGLNVVMVLVFILGLMALVVGILVALPVIALADVVVYRKLAENKGLQRISI